MSPVVAPSETCRSRRMSALRPGQRTQSWLAVSDEPSALVSGRYWHHLRQALPASEASDPKFQDRLIAELGELTGVTIPEP